MKYNQVKKEVIKKKKMNFLTNIFYEENLVEII